MSGITKENDQQQIIQSVYDPDANALAVTAGGSSLTPSAYDEVDLTYVPSGNGAGQIATVVYKLESITVATVTMTYNSDNKLVSSVRS